jgi:hypothetical protein
MDPYGQNRQLEEAARRSPELAAILAGKHDDPFARYRRLALVVGAVAIAAVALYFAGRALLGSRRSEQAVEIDRSVYLPPIKTERTAPNEETSPFTGFAVTVDTDPPGAVVSIGGKVRGEAPVLANVECSGAEKVVVTARKEGYRPTRREVQCRADLLVKLLIRLDR